MSNPFKKIGYHHEVPKALKQRVINDINLMKLTLELSDFFWLKHPITVGDFFTGGKKNENS